MSRYLINAPLPQVRVLQSSYLCDTCRHCVFRSEGYEPKSGIKTARCECTLAMDTLVAIEIDYSMMHDEQCENYAPIVRMMEE